MTVSNEPRMVRLFGLLTFLAAVVPYLLTVQPSIPFWDCGEFIACSYSLGVPHPPGTPFFIILGRVVILALSFVKDVAYRVNLISVFSNAVSVLLIYLTAVRVLRSLFNTGAETNGLTRFLPVMGAFTGALFTAFSYTWWFNCVEAEVYGIAMLAIMLQIWLAFKWLDHKDTPAGNRYLLLIMYVGFLGVGAALTSVILMPLVFLFILINKPELAKWWQLWLIGFCLLSVMYSISSFVMIAPVMLIVTLLWMFLSPDTAKKVNLAFLGLISFLTLKNALPSGGGEDAFNGLNFILGLVYAAIAVLPMVLRQEPQEKEKQRWRLCFYLVLFAFLGYSVHAVIPIRSWLDPIVDENNPEVVISGVAGAVNAVTDLFKEDGGPTWNKLFYFLERKQYGNESMVMRMFHRRGELWSQFINHQHMGFGGYLAVQFFNFGDIEAGKITLGNNAFLKFLKLLAYLVPIIFVAWAVGYLYRRNRNAALFLGGSLLACTIGLVFYMNFADGTIPEYRELVQWEQSGRMGPQPQPIQMEVRERDYFWTPGFMLYGMWIGLGFACLLHLLLSRYGDRIRRFMPAIVVLVMVTPVLPLSMNMASRTRANNWVAYDYAFNLLQSCDKDAVLFTNGDNDTFPLWALQEAYGIRTDVRIVNLSLLNTDWYIAQLMENEPRLDIPTIVFDEEFRPHPLGREQFIKQMNHRRNLLKAPLKARISRWNLEIELPDQKQMSFVRIQDYMILNIVHGNAGVKPVYFAVTVSEGNLMGLMPYLTMEGLAYRLTNERHDARMNLPVTLQRLNQVYRFTNLGRPDAFLSDETERLLSNYAACFIGYVYEERSNLASLRERENALKRDLEAQNTAKKADAQKVAALQTELATARRQANAVFDKMRLQLSRCVSILPMDWRGRLLSAQIFAGDNKFDLAEKVLRQGLELSPGEYMYNVNLGFLLRDQNKSKEAVPFLEKVVNEVDSDFRNLKHRETVGAVSALIDIYRAQNDKVKLEGLLRRWIEVNPNDRRAIDELERLKSNG